MGYSLERAIANARALELNLTSYELRQEDLLSVSLEAGRTDMLTWQQAEVIIQALEAGVITLARRPLTGTEVEHPPRHMCRIPEPLCREIHMKLPRAALNFSTASAGVGPLQRVQN